MNKDKETITKPADTRSAGAAGSTSKVDRVKVLFEKRIPIDEIRIEKNFRKHFDEKSLKELAGSIKSKGVLQSVFVRRNGKGYILIAGERRIRGSKIAGVKDIPARCFDVDAAGGAEIQALENLHRKDLTPIEEARAFKTLVDGKKYSTEELAERIDKSVGYVYRQLRLLDLPEAIQTMIEDGEATAAQGLQVLRVPKEGQADIIKMIREGNNAQSIKREVDGRVGLSLSKAEFPKDVRYAGIDACTGCVFNSGNQGMLFDGAKAGTCMKPKCFRKKNEAALHVKAKKGWAKYPELKCLGFKIQSTYNGFKLDEVGDDRQKSKTFKLAIKDHPDKFATVILQNTYYGHDPKWALVCKDAKLFQKLETKYNKERWPQHYSGGSSRPSGPSPKQKYCDGKVKVAILEAIAARSKKLTRKHWLVIISQLAYCDYEKHIFTRIGLEPKRGDIPDLKKVAEKELPAIAVMLACSSFGNLHEGEASKVGVDVKGIRKKTKASAGKEFESNKKKKKKSK